jgi:hypothetical protein
MSNNFICQLLLLLVCLLNLYVFDVVNGWSSGWNNGGSWSKGSKGSKGGDHRWYTPSPTHEPTEERMEGPCLRFAGAAYSNDGWSCSSQSNDDIDGLLDSYCNRLYPGSRAISGSDIINGGYQNIMNLMQSYPSAPGSFLPACPECGDGCPTGRPRVGIMSIEEWNEFPDQWSVFTSANSVVALCVYDDC